jgi:hypothetical protein
MRAPNAAATRGRTHATAGAADEPNLRTFLANASAPDDVWAMTSLVSLAFIGSEHVTIALPERSPACLTRRQLATSARPATVHPHSARPRAVCQPARARHLSSEPLQLSLAMRIAEDHFVSRVAEDRPELAAHQPRTENANTHGPFLQRLARGPPDIARVERHAVSGPSSAASVLDNARRAP